MTRGLRGFDTNNGEPSWGRWFRIIGAKPTSGVTIMTGADDKPLLVLSRVDKGRVGLLLTDQMWLWARDYDGGGPYLDLLRRLAHWLMKEPDLEEEALRANAKGREVTVERQSMSGEARETDLVAPDGSKTKLDMTPYAPGLSRAHLTVSQFGLYRAEDGKHVALVNVGQENPLEMRDVVSNTEKLRPITEATGGTTRRIADAGVAVVMPRVVSLKSVFELRRRGLHRRQADGIDRVDRRAFDFACFRILRPRGAVRYNNTRVGERGRRFETRQRWGSAERRLVAVLPTTSPRPKDSERFL